MSNTGSSICALELVPPKTWMMAMGVFVVHIWDTVFEKIEQLQKGLNWCKYDVTYIFDENSGERYWALQEKLLINNLNDKTPELSYSRLGLDKTL